MSTFISPLKPFLKNSVMISLLCFLLLMGSCVQSLHPLYTENDLVFEPALVGTWAGEGGNLWIFLKSGEKAYELIYVEKESPAKFLAHLVRLDKFLFLDLFPESPDLKNDLQQAHLLNTHTFSRVWLDGDTLRLAMLEHDWTRTMIDQKKTTIKYERLGDRIVLTASTKELQSFIGKHGDNNEAFPKPKSGLIRRK